MLTVAEVRAVLHIDDERDISSPLPGVDESEPLDPIEVPERAQIGIDDFLGALAATTTPPPPPDPDERRDDRGEQRPEPPGDEWIVE